MTRTGRTGPILAALACTILLGVLWVLRPPLPQIQSLTGSMSSTTFEELIQLIAWVLLTLAVLRLDYEALRTLAERPSRRRLDEYERLQRALTPPVPPSEEPRFYKRYRPPLKLAFRPAVDGGYGAEATVHNAASSPPAAAGSVSADRPVLRVSLLGPFRIEGVKHTAPRSATEQLIAYLALRPRGASRDQLIEAIWPEEDPHQARQRFWQNVSDARNLLAGALHSKRGHYTLDRHDVTIDADELQQLVAEADAADEPKVQRPILERALLLFRGEPLTGWDYTWAEEEVRALRSTHVELLERTGHARLVSGDAHGALQAAQQGLALDNYNEGLWRLAMQAESRLGLRDSITQRYQQLRDLLDEQLGLEPERATRALYHELLGQR
jgi:DNA-binding SARP family transcriptional activator